MPLFPPPSPQPLPPAAGVTFCADCVVPFPARPTEEPCPVQPFGWAVSVFTAGLAIVTMAYFLLLFLLTYNLVLNVYTFFQFGSC